MSILQRFRYYSEDVESGSELEHSDEQYSTDEEEWGIVIHGCIDGFSRKLIYCEVSDNNKGRQVKEYFIAAIRREGYPCAIRVDYGVENRASARVQWALRHLSEGAVLTGSSTRNTRIERTWRDITERVSKFYIEYLDHLSGFGVGPDFQIDRWLVHYLLVPRMKEDLSEFVYFFHILFFNLY